MRGSTQGGRFDVRFEVDSMHEGMADDLYDPVGMVFDWYLYRPDLTNVDPVYEIGDPGTGGRHWSGPHRIPVLGVRFTQGATAQNKLGLYTSDTLHALLNVGQLDKVLFDFSNEDDPDKHYKDRFLYNGELWEPIRLWVRGRVGPFSTVASLDATQVKEEQVVNDVQYSDYADPGSSYLIETVSDSEALSDGRI